MQCPKCKADYRFINVIDSRETPFDTIRRRRLCTKCKYRFTTHEITEIKKAKYEKIEKENEKLKERLETLKEILNSN